MDAVRVLARELADSDDVVPEAVGATAKPGRMMPCFPTFPERGERHCAMGYVAQHPEPYGEVEEA